MATEDDGWITAEPYGTLSCSTSIGSNKDQRWHSNSSSVICYADLENAVGNIMVTITGGGGVSDTNCDWSTGYSCTAEFNGITANNSGNTAIINVGDTPVSGTIKVTLNCSASVRSFSNRSASASCSLSSIKYKKGHFVAPPINIVGDGKIFYHVLYGVGD